MEQRGTLWNLRSGAFLNGSVFISYLRDGGSCVCVCFVCDGKHD